MASRDLVPVTGNVWQVIKDIAPVAQASRMFAVSEEQAAIVMLKGHELGLGLVAAFEFIHVIGGKPSISPKGALALIHQSGELDSLEIIDNEDSQGNAFSCSVVMRRTNGVEYGTTYSVADAAKAGLVKPEGAWTTYPGNMCRWRAIGYCADIVFPDVIGGMIRPEELGATVDGEGTPVIITAKAKTVPAATPGKFEPWPIVDGRTYPPTPASTEDPETSSVSERLGQLVQEAPEKPVPTPEPETPAAPTAALATLMEAGYNPAEIMAANNGAIPTTSAECVQVLAKLKEAQ